MKLAYHHPVLFSNEEELLTKISFDDTCRLVIWLTVREREGERERERGRKRGREREREKNYASLTGLLSG